MYEPHHPVRHPRPAATGGAGTAANGRRHSPRRDINSQAVVDKLASFAPLYVVRGNNYKDWAEDIPHDLTVTLEGVRFYMVHNKKDVPADLTGADVVVFGHSHKYSEERRGDVLWLNPGSCGPRRFH